VSINIDRLKLLDALNVVDEVKAKLPPVTEASYIVYKEGDTYYAKNGRTGQVEFSGTDASGVIQGAIDALPYGGEILIKEGVYLVNNTINLANNITIRGLGYATELRTDSPIPIINIDGKVRVSVRDIILSNPTRPAGSRGLRCVDCERVEIVNVWTYGSEIGIEIMGDAKDKSIYLENVQATDADIGIYIWGLVDEVRFLHPRVFANTVRGIIIDSCRGGSVHIVHPDIQNPGAQQSIWIVNCTNDETKIEGGGIYGAELRGLEISDNTSRIRISDFTVVASKREGVYIYRTDNVELINVHIRDCSQEGAGLYSALVIDDSKHVKVHAFITGALHKYDIEERGAADYNYIFGGVFTRLEKLGANTIVRNNFGYRTENSGVAVIPAGSTRVSVSHGLAKAPSKVLATPYGDIKIWIENITDTTFDIVTDTAPDTDVNIAWYAEV